MMDDLPQRPPRPPVPRFLAAVGAGELAVAIMVIPLDPSLDTLPVALIGGGFAAIPATAFTVSAAGWLPKLGWGRRWAAFAGGTIAALLPWAALWLYDRTEVAEIPLDELALWGAVVTSVACLGATAALRVLDR